MSSVIQPRYPLYVVSKGRWKPRQTIKALERMGVPFYVVVERQERKKYKAVVKGGKVLVLDPAYQRDYETCDALGDSKSRGPGPARNFAWDHAKAHGHAWHWVMDDNIKGFYRYNHNLKTPCSSSAFFCAMEDFVGRYTNVLMAGPQYFMFVSRKSGGHPPFVTNTRIYSCNLIRCDAQYRWRGRYNEDTDISLRMLKDGWCTIQFNAFLQYKLPTQTVRGWCTDEFYFVEGDKRKGMRYAKGGTLAKSKLLVKMHPDVAKLVWKFGRWHHTVNYRGFRRNKLIRRTDLVVAAGVNNYGMKLIKVKPKRRAKQG